VAVLEYIKWNCFDLAEQNEMLEGCRRVLDRLNGELRSVVRSLDSQIRSYPGIQEALDEVLAETEVSVGRLADCRVMLDRAVDIYYLAEARTKELSESLPARLSDQGNRTGGAMNDISLSPETSNIIGNSIVLEDWLIKLALRNETT
jgi:hypothetical protein